MSVTISGGNFHRASAVPLLKDGLPDTTVTWSGVTVSPDGTSVTATLTISSAATTGARVLQVVSSHGRSSNLNLGANVFTVQP